MKKVMLLAALGAFLCIGEKPAFALTGVACVPLNQGTVNYSAQGRAQNPHTTYGQWYSCPYLTTQTNNRTVTVIDLNGSYEVICATRRINDVGQITWSSAGRYSSGSSSSPQYLTWTNDPPGGSGYNYSFDCSIPPFTGTYYSAILSYTWS
jgi:hypothetical protein